MSSKPLNNQEQERELTTSSSCLVDRTQPTPLPWRQVIILLLVRVAEPISFNLLFPFIYFMIRDFHLTDDEKQIGYYVGFVASSFAIAQTISGIPIGMISDRIGRKPVIIAGLIGTSLNLFLFGLSTSLLWAIVTRSLCGLLNGNVGVLKSMMGELTDSTNRAKGFSLLPMINGLGSTVGPMIGGFLSRPVQNYPHLFKDGPIRDFFLKFPYFLPCGVSATLMLCSAVIAFFGLEETLDTTPDVPEPGHKITQSESEPLLNTNKLGSSKNYTDPTTSEQSNHNATSNSNMVEDQQSTSDSGIRAISSESWKSIISYAGLSFQTTMTEELFPIWAATPFILGGLNFESSDIGVVMAFCGTSLLVIQLLFYIPIHDKIGTMASYKMSFLLCAPVTLMFPLVRSLSFPDHKWLLWPLIILLNAARAFCVVFSFTSISILIAETSQNKKTRGLINGVALCSVSLARAIAPSLCGILFAWSLTNNSGSSLLRAPFTWILIAIISVLNYFLARKIKS